MKRLDYVIPIPVVVLVVDAWMICQLYGYAKLQSQRNHIITSRFPLCALLFGASLTLYFTFLPVVRITWGAFGEVSCDWTLTVDQIFISVVISLMMCRMYLLVITCKLQKQISDNGALFAAKLLGDKSSPKPSSWLIEHKKLRNPWFLSAWVILISVMLSSGPLIGSIRCVNSQILTFGFILGPAILFVVILVQIFSAKEVMHIKQEIRAMLPAVTIRLLMKNLCIFLYPLTPAYTIGPFAAYEVLGLGFTILAFGIAIVYPQKIAKKERLQDEETDVDMCGFLRAGNGGFQCFQEYLVLEFSVETLLFWEDCRHFEISPSVEKALLIYNRYIASTAPLEIHLPEGIRAEVTLSLQTYLQTPVQTASTAANQYYNFTTFDSTTSRSTPATQEDTSTPPVLHLKQQHREIQPETSRQRESALKPQHSQQNYDDNERLSWDLESTGEFDSVFTKARDFVESRLKDGAWKRFLCSEYFQILECS